MKISIYALLLLFTWCTPHMTDDDIPDVPEPDEPIVLNVRVHLMQTDPWEHPSGVEMRSWITKGNVERSIMPDVNLIWRAQTDIVWNIESVINEPIQKYRGYRDDINFIVNATRIENALYDPALPRYFDFMDPENMSTQAELDENLFHIYIFPFMGNTSEGNAMEKFDFHSVVGSWTNKHNGGGNPEKTLFAERNDEFVRGSISRTIAQKLGYVLGLTSNCENCLMDNNGGYIISPDQVDVATAEAERRSF